MQIGSYDIEDKYVAGGAAVLVLGGILLSKRGQSSKDPEIAQIRPADGLSWSDIVGNSDKGRLIGPGGDPGPGGDTGPPGLPGKNPPSVVVDPPGSNDPPPDTTTPDPTDPNPKDPKNPNKGKDECRNDNQCRNNEKCRHGKCVPANDGSRNGGRNNNQGEFTPVPQQPDRNNDPNNGNRNDPRLDTPRDRQRRHNARGITDTKPNQDRSNNNDQERTRNNDTVNVDPVFGHIRIHNGGGREKSTGKNANSNADGGTVNLGDVQHGTRGDIDVGGGRAISISDDAERKKREKDNQARQAQQNNNNRNNNNNNNKKGKGGYGGPDENGFGRVDGNDSTGESWTRTNISPGSITGGFMPVPAVLTNGKGTAQIREGETLKGLARRQMGLTSFWPRFTTTSEDIETPRGHIPAGTKFRY